MATMVTKQHSNRIKTESLGKQDNHNGSKQNNHKCTQVFGKVPAIVRL
jgi:hypothetical protein